MSILEFLNSDPRGRFVLRELNSLYALKTQLTKLKISLPALTDQFIQNNRVDFSNVNLLQSQNFVTQTVDRVEILTPQIINAHLYNTSLLYKSVVESRGDIFPILERFVNPFQATIAQLQEQLTTKEAEILKLGNLEQAHLKEIQALVDRLNDVIANSNQVKILLAESATLIDQLTIALTDANTIQKYTQLLTENAKLKSQIEKMKIAQKDELELLKQTTKLKSIQVRLPNEQNQTVQVQKIKIDDVQL